MCLFFYIVCKIKIMKTNGKLYVVGTPIGNLADMTYRAVETLKMVDYIACEDTRVSLKLLQHFQINHKKMISYHNFNEKTATKQIIKLLANNQNVALISDAGMPTIADPGFEIIKEVKAQNFDLEIIPGVSALTSAMALSSFGPEFSFLAFGKQTKAQLETQVQNLDQGTYVLFVAPHKLAFLLDLITKYFPDNNQVFLAKELTKMHQSFYQGSALMVKEQIQDHYKGEFTICIKINKIKTAKVNKYPKQV